MKYRGLKLAACVLFMMLPGCASNLTSINQLPDGRYVITGTKQQFLGFRGFVWIGTFDRETKTMRITEVQR